MLKEVKLGDFLLLLIGFIYGNLFAINFSNTNWNFFLIFFIVFFLELLNKFLYLNFLNFAKQEFNYFYENFIFKDSLKKNTNLMTKNYFVNIFLVINTIKRGFLLGFFLEAFKVGS